MSTNASVHGRQAAAAALLLTLLATSPARAQGAKPLTKPGRAPTTIVLVHGAWADGSSWDKVVPLLLAKGYDVIAVHNPLSSLADDVATVKRIIHAQPGDVLLVGHSYGGIVITEAGTEDKVKGLVYVAAFGLDVNESMTGLGKGQPPPPWQKELKVDEGGFSWLTPKGVREDFAQDLSAADQKLVAAKEGWTSVKVFDAQPRVAAWKTKPSWYIRAAQDRMIPPPAEEMMAKRMKAKLTSLDASHVVMLSKPKEVAAVILEAAKSSD